MDACVGSAGGWADVEAYEAAERAGRLPLRMTMAMGGGPAGIAEEAFAKGYVTGKGSGRLRVGPVKFFTDGSAGGCTAAMSKPYANGELGDLLTLPAGGSRLPFSQEVLADRLHFVRMKGREIFKVAVRVLTERCREALNANETLPGGVRLLLELPPGPALSGTLSLDWVRPNLTHPQGKS